MAQTCQGLEMSESKRRSWTKNLVLSALTASVSASAAPKSTWIVVSWTIGWLRTALDPDPASAKSRELLYLPVYYAPRS